MKKLSLALLTLLVGVLAYEIKHPEERFEKVANKCLPATVEITIDYTIPDLFTGHQRNAVITGSGVFITPDGYILTCAHLFTLPYEHSKLANITLYSGEIVAGEIIAISEEDDLALLRAPFVKNGKYVQLADPRKLKVGQELIAIGSPLGLSFTVTHGIISALYRDISDNYNVNQHDVFMNPGNSGGPVLNLKGELVGINSFIISTTPFFPTFSGLGFSVQSGQCLEFLVKQGETINPYRRYKWLQMLANVKKYMHTKLAHSKLM